MPRRKLTDLTVKALVAKPPKEGRTDFFDMKLPAFGIRVSKTGSASWFCFYRIDGAQVRDVFDRYPARSLTDARKKARRRLDLVDRGRGPNKLVIGGNDAGDAFFYRGHKDELRITLESRYGTDDDLPEPTAAFPRS